MESVINYKEKEKVYPMLMRNGHGCIFLMVNETQGVIMSGNMTVGKLVEVRSAFELSVFEGSVMLSNEKG